jgi:hypothetical protein
MSKVNKYNLIWWDDDGAPLATCDDEYTLPVIEGDTLSFYVNFFDSYTDSIDTYELGWWCEGAIIIRNIATLTADAVDVINRNIYATVTIGVLPRSLIRLVIYDTADSDAIKLWSVGFRFKQLTTGTAVMRYRNYRDTLNFAFENVTAFYNEHRVDVRIGEPIASLDTDGYETADGHTVISKSIHKVTREFETQDFDEHAHAGFNAATRMSDLYFDGERYERTAGAQYTQETIGKDYSFWFGRIRLEQYDYTAVATNT